MPEEGPFIALSERDIENALIDAHWRYGSQIHRKAAEALVNSLGLEPSDPATGHALFSRLFGEYAASLETYAAWGWSLRRRTEPGSLLKRYVRYRPSDVPKFWTIVRDHTGDLSDLLKLPAADEIVTVAVARHEELPPEERVDLPPEGYRSTLASQYERLKNSAERYFADERLLIEVYNKTKHGAPMLQLFEPENPRRFEFVMRNTLGGVTTERPYQFAAFTVNRAEVEKYLTNVNVMSEAIAELAVITKLLLDSGLLYDEVDASQ